MVDNPGNNADWFVTFKPLYTLQPVKATRDKQLKLWVDLIIRYCREHNVTSIHPTTFPLFRNDAIDRQLSHDGIAAVVESMIATGCAEWEDGSRRMLQIILKAPEVVASDIYKWATENDLLGSVSTVYELYAGEDTTAPFHGADAALIRRALGVLQATGRCLVIAGATPEEDGVKFLAVS